MCKVYRQYIVIQSACTADVGAGLWLICLVLAESNDNAIVINYCILYAKQYIYLEN